MKNPATDLRRRLNELGDEPTTAWKPNPGDTLVGELVGVDLRATEYDPEVPVLTLRTETEGLMEVWAFHTVLRGELRKVEPQPGEWLAIRRLEDSDRGYKRYRVIPDRERPREFQWGKVNTDGGDVAPEDRPELFLERDKPEKPASPLDDADDDLPF
jgi:hypothetical protein